MKWIGAVLKRTFAAGVLALAAWPAGAGVTATLDIATLNELLPAMTAQEVDVPISETRSLTARVNEIKILGFDPGAGERGEILAALELEVTDLGLTLPVRPRIALRIVRQDEQNLIELKFVKADLDIPLVGSVDVASFVPPVRFPADSVYELAGTAQNVFVRSSLTDLRLTEHLLHLEFDVKALESAP